MTTLKKPTQNTDTTTAIISCVAGAICTYVGLSYALIKETETQNKFKAELKKSFTPHAAPSAEKAIHLEGNPAEGYKVILPQKNTPNQ